MVLAVIAHVAIALFGVLGGQLTDHAHDQGIGIEELDSHTARRYPVIGAVAVGPHHLPLNLEDSMRVGKLQAEGESGMESRGIFAEHKHAGLIEIEGVPLVFLAVQNESHMTGPWRFSLSSRARRSFPFHIVFHIPPTRTGTGSPAPSPERH